MIRALWSGATGMRAQQFNIDVIANDLTNVNTTGYKKKLVNFQDLFYQELQAAGLQGGALQGNLPVGIQVGHGVAVAGTSPVLTQGNAIETGIPTDMMIDDAGSMTNNFFGVLLPDGSVGYTRDGAFRVNAEGELRTLDGLAMVPPIAGIPVPHLDLQISEDGLIQYRTEQGGDLQIAGRMTLYTFINPAGLSPIGGNNFRATEASGEAIAGAPNEDGFGRILGGWLETSNVDAITEMVNMISAQRAYEFNSRSIQTSDQMLQTVNQLKQ